MAFGTESIPRCDKIFGPGNSYVTQAKQLVSTMPGGPAIDMPAGPSEVLVIADEGANPVFVASDLLSQAEHGPDSQVILLSDSPELIANVAIEVQKQLAKLSREAIAEKALANSRAIEVDSIETAIIISNSYAPEHLILALRNPQQFLPQVKSAGSVFLGDYAPESLGDYCSGTNHVLPTNGAARAYSGVSVASFQKSISIQTVSQAGLNAIGPCAVTMANAEGLQAHANAVLLQDEHAMSVLDLVRDDLREFAGYASARRANVTGNIWLNANESPWTNAVDNGLQLNRYPEPQPQALAKRLAELYEVDTSRLMITRGSDEGIDLLVRAFCKAGEDGSSHCTAHFRNVCRLCASTKCQSIRSAR